MPAVLAVASSVKARAKALVTALAVLTMAATVVAHRVMHATHVMIRSHRVISIQAKVSKAVTKSAQRPVRLSAILAVGKMMVLAVARLTKIVAQRLRVKMHVLHSAATVVTVPRVHRKVNVISAAVVTVIAVLRKNLSARLKQALVVMPKPTNLKWCEWLVVNSPSP